MPPMTGSTDPAASTAATIIPVRVDSGGRLVGMPPGTSFGIAGARFTSADQSGGVAAVTDAPTTGQKLVVTGILVSADTAMRADFSEETSGTIVASIYVAANASGQWQPQGKVKLVTANKKLMVRTSASGNVSVTACYHSEV